MLRKIPTLLLLTGLFASFQSLAHPGGNMITVGNHVFWSYIEPIEDPDHYAVVMHWTFGAKPEVIYRSEFPASDFMFTTDGEKIYIIEQRFDSSADRFMIRVLKMSVGATPDVHWNWFEDKWRIGDGGFMMTSSTTLIFGRYPRIFKLTKGGIPEVLFEFEEAVRKIRKIKNDSLLLIGESHCWLTDLSGNVIGEWKNVINPSAEQPPLNRNMIFDADFKDGRLVLANWGNRSFDLISDDGNHDILVQQEPPLVPHWVAFFQGDLLLFSSSIQMDGSAPKPRLVRYAQDGFQEVIWE